MENIKTVEDLIKSYKKLPGIGSKTAERLAYASLNLKKEEIDEFVSALESIETKIHFCPKCGMYIDTPFCPICDDASRDNKTLVVLTSFKTLMGFEKSGQYHGKYFILNGTISPSKGIDGEKIKLPVLTKQVEGSKELEEVIIACDSTLEGELTSRYVYKQLHKVRPELKISRLAYGLPIGADLEYVDDQTIALSFLSRTAMKGE